MRRLGLVAALVIGVLVPATARAEIVSPHADPGSGNTWVEAETSPVFRIGGGGGGGPVCQWVPLHLDRDPAGEEFTEGDIPFSPTGIGPHVREVIGGVERALYRVTCPDGPPTDRWVVADVTAADLLPGLRDRANGLVPLPEPAVNPPANVGGIVNVGLWLAVEEQTMPALTAEAGAAWITMTPRLASTRYDFGNGDVIECEGTGVPLEDVHPDFDVIEESPWCGYTYRRSSPDDDPYRLAVTAVWELPYVSSDGPGSIPPLERTATVDYDVDEIQTVGVSN